MSFHGNHLTAQTSSTGDIVNHPCTLTGFFLSPAVAVVSFSLRDSTSGSTLLTIKNSFLGGWGAHFTELPDNGIRFKNKLTVSSMTGVHSVTFTYQ